MTAPNHIAESTADLEMSPAFDALLLAYNTARENGRSRSKSVDEILADFIGDRLWVVLQEAKAEIHRLAKLDAHARAAQRAEDDAEDAADAERAAA